MKKLYKIKTKNEIVSCPGTGLVHIGVTIHWFCDNRLEPIVQFEEAIPQWKDILQNDYLSDRQLSYYNIAATYLDQLFTFEEAMTMQNHLKQEQASDVVLEEVSLPLKDADVPFAVLSQHKNESGEYGFINLPGDSPTPLPARVRGFFDTKYTCTLQRYQESIVKMLAGFKQPIVGKDYSHFREMVNSFKLQLGELQDSLVNLKNVLEIISGGLSSSNIDFVDAYPPDEEGSR